MTMVDILSQMMLKKAKSDPRLANNPVAQNYIRIIESGDAERGKQIAENLCRTNGTTPQQAVDDATKFFKL